ncbi:MAG TPA: AAA family ATPase [Bellilinea sp.]|nr:AAA family ATPase [Bellilinea sp.]
MGPPEVRLGEHLVSFPTRKTQALLFYLAIEKNQQPREHLASLFWPEASSEQSSASLRNTLSRLQSALRSASGKTELPYLSITNTSIGLDPDANIQLDLETVERAFALANTNRSGKSLSDAPANLAVLQSAADCQRGPFLAGLTLGDAPGFDDWVGLQREDWQRCLGLIFDRLSEIQFARGEFVDAAQTASRWIALDTLSEAAYRRKMRVHLAAGERGKALETYDACRKALESELGIEPEPDTDALAERIRSQPAAERPHLRRTPDQPPRAETSVDFLGSLFTGRNNEVQALTDSYQRAAGGQPQVVILRGESGIGKTRLAIRFLAWARAQGAEVLHGGAFESGSYFPFQPLADALRTRFESEKSLEEWQDGIWTAVLNQLLPELRGRIPNQPESPLGAGPLDAEFNPLTFFESLVQLTLAFAQRGVLVLLIDDLQWADSATLDFLLYAIRRWRVKGAAGEGHRILLLVSLRTESLATINPSGAGDGASALIQWLARVEREVKPVQIDLAPLGEPETVELIQSILSPPAPEFAQGLYTETRGHPYYMIEILKDLLEQRVLRPKRKAQGSWTFSVNGSYKFGQTDRIPSTVYSVIRSRLNRLSPNAFALLAAGSVLEQEITFEHLAGVANVNEDLALAALDELITGRLFLESGAPGAASEYIFVNDMLRDVVYTEAGDARRRLFHRRALELLQAEGDSEAVLAHHALSAGLMSEAFRHSLAAGREALRLSAVSEAIFHFERAMQIIHEESLPEMPDAAEVQTLENQLKRAREKAARMEKEPNSLPGV